MTIQILVKICSLIIWFWYAYLEGSREAYLFHRAEVDKAAGRYLHRVWTLQRALVFILIAYVSWPTAITCMFIFPFTHDGSYYRKRNRLNANLYPKRWFAQSTTSTALLTKFETPIARTVFAIIGFSWFIVSFFI